MPSNLVTDDFFCFLSGLDSTSSLSVLDALRTVAEKGGLTIACVLHQPRYEIFSKYPANFYQLELLDKNLYF